MNPNRLLRQLLAVLLVGLLAVAVLQGCSEGPAEPVWDNPFDPDNPASSDPFGLEAIAAEASVVLAWTMLDGYGFILYIPQHRVDGGQWTNIDTLEADVGETNYIFDDPVPTATNYFRIMAMDADSVETSSNAVVPADVTMPPIITNADGEYAVATRIQDLTVAATQGDVVEVSFDTLFGTVDATAPRADDGLTMFPAFDLGPAANRNETFDLYTRTMTDLGGGLPPVYSVQGSRKFTIARTATISLAAGGSTIASPLVDLLISGEAVGIDSMRFAASDSGLWSQEWRPGAALAEDVEVLDTVASQDIEAQFKRDFGFYETTSLEVQADDLESANFTIPGLAPNRIVDTLDIGLEHDAVALEMRVSQYPDFHDTGWVAYAEVDTLHLEEVPDQHVYFVYAQYRNHWFQSTVRADWFILGPAEIAVAFANPLQDQIVQGGSTIEVTGTANPFDATVPVESVEVHLGDGWEPATGTENWETTWEVPLLTEDTQWGIGALATAGQYTSVAWISVIISQLTITIDAPADADEVTRGLLAAINGTAAPYLAGAPLDSVVVEVLNERLPSTTLESWSVTWLVPADAPDLIDITAWAYAGEDSVSQRVQVTAVGGGQ